MFVSYSHVRAFISRIFYRLEHAMAVLPKKFEDCPDHDDVMGSLGFESGTNGDFSRRGTIPRATSNFCLVILGFEASWR